MAVQLRILALEGPVSVAYRKEGGLYHAIALQFDLVGTGRTKDAAFEALQAVFDTHMRSIVRQRGAVQFLNPSPQEDWNLSDREEYQVSVLVPHATPVPKRRALPLDSIPKLPVRHAALVPA